MPIKVFLSFSNSQNIYMKYAEARQTHLKLGKPDKASKIAACKYFQSKKREIGKDQHREALMGK